MSAAPLCRYCGKAIRKKTCTIWFGRADRNISTPDFTFSSEKPLSKAEAQRHSNAQIVSVGWHRINYEYQNRDPNEIEYIDKASTWDGESYVDPFFCNGDHAKRFAYVLARAGHATQAYSAAYKPVKP